MGTDAEDGSQTRSAIPLTAGAIVLAQLTMAGATWGGDRLTLSGIGRKPLFLAGLASLPIRCALIIFWKDAGDSWLLSTQVLDGLGGGLCGLIHPYLVADITFGTGRFNVVSKLFDRNCVWFQYILVALDINLMFDTRFQQFSNVIIPFVLYDRRIHTTQWD